MSWEDKTVSLDNVDSREFESELAHVRVSENGISVGFKDVDDWKRIQREIGEEKILKEVEWDEVEELGKETDHLYYPHIDVGTDEGEKRLYFLEDEDEALEECISTIKLFWNAYRQRGAGSRDTYSYREGEKGDTGDEGEEAELVEEKEKDEDEEEDEGDGDEGSVKDVVEGFMGD